MPLRRLIALIVDTHLPAPTGPEAYTTRKTILLHIHPAHRRLKTRSSMPWAARRMPSLRMPYAAWPGDLCATPAGNTQPDKCLFTMSNNAATLVGTGETPSSFPGSRKNAFLLGQLRDTLFPQEDGGARRDRTDDLLNANQALSQLSYGPSKMVGLGRLELPTSRLSSARSNQLSYKPVSAQKRPAPFDAGHPVQSLSVKKEKRRRRCPAL
jgi:hypothetical protein